MAENRTSTRGGAAGQPQPFGNYSIHELINGGGMANIWLATDQGLHKLSPGLSLVASYDTHEGLPNNQILGVREDNNGNLWITTKTGLSRLDPVTHKFKNFNTHDCLQGMEFQSKSIDRTKDGRILVGGINGFNIFEPGKILSDTARPRLLFTDFRIFNRLPGISVLLVYRKLRDVKRRKGTCKVKVYCCFLHIKKNIV